VLPFDQILFDFIQGVPWNQNQAMIRLNNDGQNVFLNNLRTKAKRLLCNTKETLVSMAVHRASKKKQNS
jgi:hypothetical protein